MTTEDVIDRLAGLTSQAWIAAAVGVALELGLPARMREPADPERLASGTGLSVPLAGALAEALVAGGLAERTDSGYVGAPALVELARGPGERFLRAETRAGLLQLAAFFDAATRGAVHPGWSHDDERILEAQGTASAGAVTQLERDVLPQMTGMRARLDSGRGVLLDVGAGVAAVTIELCRRHPRLRAVALEPHEPARRLAERHVAEAGLGDRIEVRSGRLEELDAEEAFDLIWLPGSFLAPDVLHAALRAVRRALRPGGYVTTSSLGHPGEDDRAVAARLRAVLWGRDVVAPALIATWLEEAGLCEVTLMPALPNGLVPMRARRPSIG